METGVVLQPVTSSHIEALGYKDGILYAQFKGGSVYRYEGVAPDVWDGLRSAESVGKFFHSEVKGHFQGVKLTPEEVEALNQ